MTNALPAWAATTAYTVGEYVSLSGGSVLLCTTAGTSGSTAPTAPGVGGAVTDGTVHWVQTALAFGSWPTQVIDGTNYFIMSTAQFRVPVDFDPTSLMFVAFAAPTGGVGGMTAIAQGPPGDSPSIDSTVNLTELASTDSTPASASFTEISPDVYQLTAAFHAGATGAAGTSTLDPTSYGTPLAGQLLIVNTSVDGFIYQPQLNYQRIIPATINNTSSGHSNSTLATVTAGPFLSDVRPIPRGCCVVTGTGTDVAVDLLVRLNGETGGNIVARAFGLPGQNPPPHILSACPPPASADSFDRIVAGTTAVLYLRAEQQSGTDSFTTSASQTLFCVDFEAVPYGL